VEKKRFTKREKSREKKFGFGKRLDLPAADDGSPKKLMEGIIPAARGREEGERIRGLMRYI